MKNILITGGAGFIGSNLALKLIEKGYTITVLDNLSTQIHGENPEKTSPLYQSIKDKANFIKGTVTSKEDWEKALKGQDAVVHYAAETGTGQSMYCIEKYAEVNMQGTAIMLDILANDKSHQVKKVVVASSRSIYGEGKYDCPKCGIVYPNERKDEDMKNGDFSVKSISGRDVSYADLLSLHCISHGPTFFYSAGGAKTRFEKFKYISKHPLTKKHLFSCLNQDFNCGVCVKCMRNLFLQNI